MRLSVRVDDPGYDSKAFGAKVFVDEIEITLCHTADEEQGVAVCYIADAKGQPTADPTWPFRAAEVIRRGAVRIVPGPGAP